MQHRPLSMPASLNDVGTGQANVHLALVFAVVQLNRVSYLLDFSHTLLETSHFLFVSLPCTVSICKL